MGQVIFCPDFRLAANADLACSERTCVYCHPRPVRWRLRVGGCGRDGRLLPAGDPERAGGGAAMTRRLLIMALLLLLILLVWLALASEAVGDPGAPTHLTSRNGGSVGTPPPCDGVRCPTSPPDGYVVHLPMVVKGWPQLPPPPTQPRPGPGEE